MCDPRSVSANPDAGGPGGANATPRQPDDLDV